MQFADISPPSQPDLPKRMPRVDEQPPRRFQYRPQSFKGALLDIRVASIQRPHTHRKGDVERLFTRRQCEILDRRSQEPQAAGGDFRLRSGNRAFDRLGRAVDGQDEAVPDTAGNLAGGHARTAAYLEHPMLGASGRASTKDAIRFEIRGA